MSRVYCNGGIFPPELQGKLTENQWGEICDEYKVFYTFLYDLLSDITNYINRQQYLLVIREHLRLNHVCLSFAYLAAGLYAAAILVSQLISVI